MEEEAETFEIDDLMLQASQEFESGLTTNIAIGNLPKQHDVRFAEPITEDMIIQKINGAIPKSTRRTTQWAVKVWDTWAAERNSRVSGSNENPVVPLETIDNEQLNIFLSRFVNEARNSNGEPYTGGTLYSLCAGIQRFVRQNRASTPRSAPLDIYKDPGFSFFRGALDSVLKELHRSGIGTVKKQAEVVSCETESRFWEDGILGDDSPQKLLDTLIYVLGLNLALRSGKEHRDLRPSMFEVIQSGEENGSSSRSSTPPYLVYSECGSKNHTGGLKERRVTNKCVKVFSNTDELNKCPVALYTKYMSLRPHNAPTNALYLKPLQHPTNDCWYQPRPVGHNILSNTIKRLCSKAGIVGNYSNHSLRRTCATRLYQQGAPDDQIMAVTGHRTSNGLKPYKRTSIHQEEKLSKMIQCPPAKKRSFDDADNQPDSTEKENIAPYKPIGEQPHQVVQVHHSENKPTLSPVAFNFQSCSVTVNYR